MNFQTIENRAGPLRVWDEPVEGRDYVIGVDVATGAVKDRGMVSRGQGFIVRPGDRPDYTAMVVLDMLTGQHVATWRGYVELLEGAEVAVALGWMYNKALLIVEATGPGMGTIEAIVHQLKYPRMYARKTYNTVEGMRETEQYGWSTNTLTRPMLISLVQDAITADACLTRDEMLVDEARTMVFDESGIPRARGRDKDDIVMAFGLALRARYESIQGRDVVATDHLRHLPDYDKKVWQDIERRRKKHGVRFDLGRSSPDNSWASRPNVLHRRGL